MNKKGIVTVFILILGVLSLFFIFKQHSVRSLQKISLPSITPQTQSIDPYAISNLQKRSYAGSQITEKEQVAGGSNFTSRIITFTSDGLTEYALMNIPTSLKPQGGFPVLILNHGYINPKQYDTINSYKGVTDFFSMQGFLVIKPDYRGNANSQDNNDGLERYGYPVDVMNLLTSVKNIPEANPQKVFLWGHSMGGEVTLTVLEILPHQLLLKNTVKATVLWAPVTDPIKWFEKSHRNQLPEAAVSPYPYTKTFQILGEPSANNKNWQELSPLNYLSDISLPLQLNHGTADPTVPYSWSLELVSMLQKLGKQVDFKSYLSADHNLSPVSGQALQNNLTFFNLYK